MPTRSQRHLREFRGVDVTGEEQKGGSVAILTPAAGAVALTLTVSSQARNAEGGDVSHLVDWSSNVDGALRKGDGPVTLTAGAHTLTAEYGGVTDTVAVTAS